MAGGKVPLTFRLFKGDELLREEKLTLPVIKVGKLSSSHLRLDDKNVSRMHALIEVTGPGDVSIIDLSSTTGTFVNGQKVNKAKLQSGDSIVIGETRIEVTIGGAEEEDEIPTKVQAGPADAGVIASTPRPPVPAAPPAAASAPTMMGAPPAAAPTAPTAPTARVALAALAALTATAACGRDEPRLPAGDPATSALRALRDEACGCRDAACAYRALAGLQRHAERTPLRTTRADVLLLDELAACAAAAAPHAPAVVEVPDGPPRIGIPACDDYATLIESYLQCDQFPASARDSTRQAIDEMRKAWADLRALPPDARRTAEDACRQASDAIRQASDAMGCPLPGAGP